MLEFKKNIADENKFIFSPQALKFIEQLQINFAGEIAKALELRKKRDFSLRNGEKLDFLSHTANICSADWKVTEIPTDLQDRRVEITGPVERKMIINALNSGAKAFMADFEDSLCPSFEKIAEGQKNLYDAVRKTINFTNEDGKKYQLNQEVAVLIIRPRGLHLPENNIHLNNKPIAGCLLDFGLYFFHNAEELLKGNSGPYFYLPKLESHLEAAIWAKIFSFSEEYLGIKKSTIKATVLIETITAAFEMEEILYELKDYIVAQNAGRWDYIFSYIKKHAYDANFVCPNRGQIVMTQHFLRSYSKLLIKTCHKRGAMAMGGMSAFIPIKNNEEANAKALAQVRADKEREASDGHDGTWVAHPALVSVAMEVFDRIMPTKNQISKPPEELNYTAADLLKVPEGTITEDGIANNISVSLQYLASWLAGNGCVPIFNLMEDAATAEISRTQLWQWIKHGAKTDSSKLIDKNLFEEIIAQEKAKLPDFSSGKSVHAINAEKILRNLVFDSELKEFLTLESLGFLG